MAIKNKVSKKVLAIILAVVLILGTFPIGFASVFAALKDTFVVEIKDYNFSAEVTLTDTTDSTVTQTESITNGRATFSAFVDDENTYNLEVTNLIGYEDFSYPGLVIEGNSLEIQKADLTEIEKATASGTVVDENNVPKSGVTISYSAYNGDVNGTTTTNADGEYSFEFYKGKEYSVTISSEEKYKIKTDTFTASIDKDLGEHKLDVKQFAINVTTGANGSTSTSNAMVNYGEDAPSIEIIANQNYIISSLTIDGAEITAAVGKNTYDVADELKNITAEHTVHAEFVLDEIEVTFTITRTGNIEIEKGTSVSTAGTVTVSNGSDETPLTEPLKLLDGQTIKATISNTKYHIESFKVGSDELITAYDNDTHESPIYTFDKTKTTISVIFALDTFNITTSAGDNGTISESTTVNYGDDASFTITPSGKDYTVDELIIDGTSIDISTLSDDEYVENENHTVTFTLLNIQADTYVEVTFKEISVDTGDWKEKISISATSGSLVSESIVNGDIVLVYSKNSSVKIKPLTPYNYFDIKYDNKTKYEGWSKERTISTSKVINNLQVKTGKRGDEINLTFTGKIRIIIDNTKPELADITAMNWSKEASYTVTGTLADENTTSNPSSGIDRVVYGTTSGYSNTTSEAILNTDKTGYSFTISNEENKIYYIYAVDKAGNVSEVKTFESKIDNTKPVIDKFEITNVANDIKTTSFGTYSNSSVTVIITASDAENCATNSETKTCSGVKTITFNRETKRVDSNHKAVFTIDSATALEIKDAYATDNAGNVGDKVAASSTNATINATINTLDSNKLTISTVKPAVAISEDVNAASDGLVRWDEKSGKVWFNGNANFIIDISDQFGIQTISIKLNDQEVKTSSDGVTLKDVDFSSSKLPTKQLLINTSMFESANKDTTGENVIEVVVMNVASNYNNDDKSAKKSSLYIDETAPTVNSFEFKARNTNFLSKTLNFLTFGIFFNEEIDVTVNVSDANASAGIKSITLYAGDKKVETKEVDGFDYDSNISDKCTFTLKMKDYDANQIISAVATDKVGNTTAEKVMPNTLNSNILEENGNVSGVNNSGLMIETVKPTATIACATPAQNKNTATADSNDWYATDTDFNITVNDPDSGIRNVVIKINGKAITTVTAKNSLDNEIAHAQYRENYDDSKAVIGYDYRADKQTTLKYVVNTSLADRADDGSYKIEVIVTDNAGNVSETFTKTIYKDIDAPSVTNFAFEAKGYDKDSSVEMTNTAPVQEKPYGFYFLEDTKVTVTAEDVLPTAGIKSITYYTVDINGTTSEVKSDNVDSNNKIYFTIPANFKGQIYAKATDNVDNVTSDFVNPNGVVVENEDQHKKTSHINYALQDSKDAAGNDVVDANGNKLYGDDTTVDVEIADTYSGIRQIDWEIITPFDDKKQAGTVTVNNDGTITSVAKDGYSDDCLGEWIVTNEENLVTVLKNTISVTNNSNDIEIHFTLTDRAGNVTKDVVQKLSVDKTAPKIAIQMNENDDETYTGFFRGKREVAVYVYERNFNSGDFTFDVKRVDDNNSESIVSPTSKFEKIGVQVIDGVECYVYKMNTTFTDDGDYRFSVNAQDTASHINNNAAANHKVKDAIVKYSSDKSVDFAAQNDADRNIDTVFTIDNTPAEVSVSYDNNDIRGEKYFNNHRTATITVKEHNFTSAKNRIIYTRTSTKDGSAITEPKVSDWSQNGNIYTATINYNADGDYTFGIDVVDKAGNELNDKGVTYTGKATKDFTVDTTIDKPIITGVENGNSYKDSVLPKINFSDINFKDYKIKLLRTRKDEIDKDVTELITISTNDKGGSFSADEDTFKKAQENDGIYTLSVEITDKAENTSSEQVTFTVNRFGSVYTLGSFLVSNLNNKYVQSVNEDIVITEYNPDKLVKGTLDVVVTRDGSPVEYKDGELRISPAVNEFAKIGDSGWYQYQYTISKNVFLDSNGDPADGIYKVYVGSEDTVGNKSENISYEDCKVMFRLDHTPPTIKSVSGLEKKIVNANELNVSYEIFDAIGIDEIIVEYYGKDGNRVTDRIASNSNNNENLTDVLSDLTSYSGKFTIGSSNGPEDVRIYIKDLAGNTTDTNDENFDIDSIDFNRQITVSTNFFVRWYADKGLFWGSIAAIVVVIGAVAFFIATKRRRRDDERTEEIKRNARGSQD